MAVRADRYELAVAISNAVNSISSAASNLRPDLTVGGSADQSIRTNGNIGIIGVGYRLQCTGGGELNFSQLLVPPVLAVAKNTVPSELTIK